MTVTAKRTAVLLLFPMAVAMGSASAEVDLDKDQAKVFRDPMMPLTRSTSGNTDAGIDLGHWHIDGVIAGSKQPLVYIDRRLLREGDRHEGLVIARIAVDHLLVKTSAGSVHRWPIPPAIADISDQGF